MAESSVAVTPGAGKLLHTNQRTITGPGTVEDEYVIPGEYPYPTFSAIGQNISGATSADHLAQLMAGASTVLRLRRLKVKQGASATAANLMRITLLRLSTAGTGGTVITGRPYDGSSVAAGTAMSLPTAKGTEAVNLGTHVLTLRQAVSATGSPADDEAWEWRQAPNGQPIIIPAGTANGIALKLGTGVAGCTFDWELEWVETSFAG